MDNQDNLMRILEVKESIANEKMIDFRMELESTEKKTKLRDKGHNDLLL